MKNKSILFFLLINVFLLPLKGDLEIVVPLSTRCPPPVSVYVAPILSTNSPFSKLHLEILRNVLIDDINKNGSCTVEASHRSSDFIINIDLKKEKLEVSILSKEQNSTPILFCEKLAGTSLDRRAIHKMSDGLTKVITGVEGIASSCILYAVQLPEKAERGGGWKSEIWESDYDGYNAKQLTRENSYCIHPTPFPVKGEFTKDKFLYVNYKLGQSKIFLGAFSPPAKGTPFVQLRGSQLLPAISKKGDMIAFISDASGRADLFVQLFNRDLGLLGKPIQLFSFPRSVQASPTFHPNGKQIAFVSDKDGIPRIFLINTPSPGKPFRPALLCLTKKYRQNTCPNWSPDGKKLAYSGMVEGNRQIMVYDFSLKEEIQITQGKAHKENPSWAQNSLHIIYNTVEPSSSELFLINIKQKKPLQITSGLGKKHYPAWKTRQI